MSIKVSITAPGLSLQAILKEEVLAQLIKLTQDFREEKTPVESQVISEGVHTTGELPKNTALLSKQEIHERLKHRGSAELLNLLRWENFPEKILLMAAWREAREGNSPWRSADIDKAFQHAKEPPPANFPRDIKRAIQQGWIHAETARTYSVTDTGWNKIAEAMKGAGE